MRISTLRGLVVRAVPIPLHPLVRRVERGFLRPLIFKLAMRLFLERPYPLSNNLLSALVYGWGNEDFSAHHEYLNASLERTQQAQGPILECGSGLSTLLVGVIAQRTSKKVWSLEHNPSWASRVSSALQKYNITSVELGLSSLRNYGPYDWYDLPKGRIPTNFSLVICDGPPGSTRGGRYGLLPVMHTYLSADCTILLDDAERESERQIATRWAKELGTIYEIEGTKKPYAVIGPFSYTPPL
jgi:hypothetical protein